jgi:hypothetical protein
MASDHSAIEACARSRALARRRGAGRFQDTARTERRVRQIELGSTVGVVEHGVMIATTSYRTKYNALWVRSPRRIGQPSPRREGGRPLRIPAPGSRCSRAPGGRGRRALKQSSDALSSHKTDRHSCSSHLRASAMANSYESPRPVASAMLNITSPKTCFACAMSGARNASSAGSR